MDANLQVSSLLLAWYDKNGRKLPFRGVQDPYKIWLSEIMLQQTRTETVGAYFNRLIRLFPDVFALANADEEQVLKAWEGLGYYSRARNLHACAQKIVQEFGGEFPTRPEIWLKLPGIGPYTAAAVCSIAFDAPIPAMDGNLTRVFARLYDVRENVCIPSVKRRLNDLAKGCMPPARCGDFNQALMDLGATICRPGTPDCEACPLKSLCIAYQEGSPEELPIMPIKTPPTVVPLNVLLITDGKKIHLVQRKEALLQGLYVFDLTGDAPDLFLKKSGIAANVSFLCHARHVFTHRVWEMDLYLAKADALPHAMENSLYSLDEMCALPLPCAMKAARQEAIKHLTEANDEPISVDRVL